MKRTFVLNKRDYHRLQGRSFRAQQKDQSEVCGAIVGLKNCLSLEFMNNHSLCPGAFKIKRIEITNLRKKLKSPKRRIFGYFHSHVVSEPTPSKRDIEGAPINSLMLIYDVCGREAALYRVVREKGKKTISMRELIVQ